MLYAAQTTLLKNERLKHSLGKSRSKVQTYANHSRMHCWWHSDTKYLIKIAPYKEVKWGSSGREASTKLDFVQSKQFLSSLVRLTLLIGWMCDVLVLKRRSWTAWVQRLHLKAIHWAEFLTFLLISSIIWKGNKWTEILCSQKYFTWWTAEMFLTNSNTDMGYRRFINDKK